MGPTDDILDVFNPPLKFLERIEFGSSTHFVDGHKESKGVSRHWFTILAFAWKELYRDIRYPTSLKERPDWPCMPDVEEHPFGRSWASVCINHNFDLGHGWEQTHPRLVNSWLADYVHFAVQSSFLRRHTIRALLYALFSTFRSFSGMHIYSKCKKLSSMV
jgi:hypothetical protein